MRCIWLWEEISERIGGHPYAYVYARHWFNQPQAESKMLFHGIALIQYYELVVMLANRFDEENLKFNEKHGLDPKTGKKLKAKKSKSKV